VVGATVAVSDNVYQTSFAQALRPLSPGEVLVTDYQRTLLKGPPTAGGRVAIFDFQYDIIDADTGRPVPLSELYNHHFVLYDSTGSPVQNVRQGGNWPPPLGDPAYPTAAAAGLSVATGPCDSVKFSHGGGAEWRGVQDQLRWSPTMPNAYSTAWVTDFSQTTFGVNIHLIDLRLVDTCGAWDGNFLQANSYNASSYASRPPAARGECLAATNPAYIKGVSHCVQCNSAYFGLVNNFDHTRFSEPLNGGMYACPDATFCDIGGYFGLQDGQPANTKARRLAAFLLYSNNVSSTDLSSAANLTIPGGALPYGAGTWLRNYTFVYTLTWTNSSTLLNNVKPLMAATFAVDSAAYASANGFSCPAEYTPSTCGQCTNNSCGVTADLYGAVLQAILGNGVSGFEDSFNGAPNTPGIMAQDRYLEAAAEYWTQILPPGMTLPNGLTGLSQCIAPMAAGPFATGIREGSNGFNRTASSFAVYNTVSSLSFTWVVPADVDVHYVTAHQHVGGVGIKVYITGADFGSSRVLGCHSEPIYAPSGDQSAGFIVSMRVCDFRAQPVRLKKGVVVTVTSEYYADSLPFMMPDGHGSLTPSPFQMPYTGVMGFASIMYTFAPAARFGWFTANGIQPVIPASVTCAPSQLVMQAAPLPPFASLTGKKLDVIAAAKTANTIMNGTAAYYLNWTISGDSIAMTITANTAYWFGLGIHSPGSSDSGMVNADLVISQSGSTTLGEYYSAGYNQPQAKGSSSPGNGLSACSSKTGVGWQQVSFTRPLLAAANSYGQSIQQGATQQIIFAMGNSALLGYHGGSPHGMAMVTW